MRLFLISGALLANLACDDITVPVPSVTVEGAEDLGSGGVDVANDPSAHWTSLIQGCVEGNQQAFPDLSVVVVVGEVQSGPYNRIASVFEAVSKASNPSDLTIVAGEYSIEAVKSGMSCILDAGVLTWSIALLNQKSGGDFAVRESGGWLTQGQTLNQIALEDVNNGRAIVFRAVVGEDSCRSVAVAAEPIPGSSDFAAPLGTKVNGGSPVEPLQECEGINCSLCLFNESGLGCADCSEPVDSGEVSGCNHSIKSPSMSFESLSHLGGS